MLMTAARASHARVGALNPRHLSLAGHVGSRPKGGALSGITKHLFVFLICGNRVSVVAQSVFAFLFFRFRVFLLFLLCEQL